MGKVTSGGVGGEHPMPGHPSQAFFRGTSPLARTVRFRRVGRPKGRHGPSTVTIEFGFRATINFATIRGQSNLAF